MFDISQDNFSQCHRCGRSYFIEEQSKEMRKRIRALYPGVLCKRCVPIVEKEAEKETR